MGTVDLEREFEEQGDAPWWPDVEIGVAQQAVVDASLEVSVLDDVDYLARHGLDNVPMRGHSCRFSRLTACGVWKNRCPGLQVVQDLGQRQTPISGSGQWLQSEPSHEPESVGLLSSPHGG